MSISDIFSLIKTDRLRKSTGGDRGLLVATESDKARVINSAPFRRLQQKTQVFPLEFNASVRSRLTHSLEVSQIGRYLSQEILKQHDNIGYDEKTAFTNIVETACLLHDIGNPPFGHFGEHAIQEWAIKKDVCEDLANFDGNPQGLRIISRLQGTDGFGLNLTATQILSTIKYPKTIANESDYKKTGIFCSEKDKYEECCHLVGWDKWKRFPLVYLMEAADDIAYSLSDLEDGLEKKILKKHALQELIDTVGIKDNGSLHWFVEFKTKIINQAVRIAAETFNRELPRIIAGEKIQLLPEDSAIKNTLDSVCKITAENVYRFHEVEEIELAGYSIISGLMDHYDKLLTVGLDDFKEICTGNKVKGGRFDIHSRLFRRLPGTHIDNYNRQSSTSDETTARHQLIVDYICGMTDDFALTTYQNLHGIRVGDA